MNGEMDLNLKPTIMTLDPNLPSTTMGFESPPEFCINCCNPLHIHEQNSVDFSLLNISESLAAIYKLNYLKVFREDQPNNWVLNPNGPAKLCPYCLDIFSNLHRFYDAFNQIRSMESILAKEIQNLDNCIEAHKILRNIKQEVQPKETNQVNKSLLQRERTIKNQNNVNTRSYSGPAPCVVVQRLEEDPLAQAFISRSKRLRANRNFETSSKRKNKKSTSIEIGGRSFRGVRERTKKKKTKKVISPRESDIEFCSDEDPSFTESESSDNEDEVDPTKKKTKRKPGSVKTFNPSAGNRKELTVRRKESRNMYQNYRRKKAKVPNPCWCCEMDFPTPAECYEHTMKEHFKRGLFVCETCARVSTTKIAHHMHLKTCDLLKPGEILPCIICEHCEKQGVHREFAIKTDLASHIMIVHDGAKDLPKCPVEGCNFVAKNPYYFKSHAERHQKRISKPPPDTTCEECQKTFKTRHSMKQHMHFYHTEEGLKKTKAMLAKQKEERAQKSAQQTTICNVCNVDFFSYMSLVHHRKEFHGEEFPIVCDMCGKRFAKSENLKFHLKFSHTEARPYVCEHCGRTYKSVRHLRDHSKQHTVGRDELNAKKRLRFRRRQLIKKALSQSFQLRQAQGQPPTNNDNNNAASSSSTAQPLTGPSLIVVNIAGQNNGQMVDMNTNTNPNSMSNNVSPHSSSCFSGDGNGDAGSNPNVNVNAHFNPNPPIQEQLGFNSSLQLGLHQYPFSNQFINH